MPYLKPEDRPEIEYPCIWSYRIIGPAGFDVETIVNAILGEREYALEPSRSSSGGKYESHNVSLVVMSEDDRRYIFHSLSKHEEIRYVL